MFCIYCGAQLPDQIKFCGKCGKSLQNVVYSQAQETNSTAAEENTTQPSENKPLCKYCGSPLTVDGATFCDMCGKPIYETPAIQQPSGDSLRTELKKGVSGKRFSFKSNQNHWTPASVFCGLNIKNKCILIAIATLAICVIAILALAANSIYYALPAGRLSIGSRYLADLEYEQAIVEFDRVLKIDPKNVNAYVSKAKAQLALGYIDDAIDTLNEGYELTSSETILSLIFEYENLTYGIITGISCIPEGSTLSKVKVTATKISDSSALNYSEQDFDAGEDIGKKYTTSTNSVGFWSLFLPRGLYSIEFKKSGYTSSAIYCEINPGQVVTTDNVVMYDSSYRSKLMPIRGQVTNGLNYQPVENAEIRFRRGWDNESGNYVRLSSSGSSSGSVTSTPYENEYIVTDSNGYFYAVLPCGTYTAEITKDGFNTSFMNVSTSEQSRSNLLITPHLDENSYRIILTWGETPFDLDSHLLGDYNGRNFEIYFRDKEYDDIAMLDVDDTSSFGPETITLNYNELMGDCHYYVHDFTNSSNSDSEELSYSRAKVIVYKGNNLAGEFSVSPGRVGTKWNVFSIIDGVLVVDDTYS